MMVYQADTLPTRGYLIGLYGETPIKSQKIVDTLAYRIYIYITMT